MKDLGKKIKTFYVYIVSIKYLTLYTRVTNDLNRRVYEHKQKLAEGFISNYDNAKLVYCETNNSVKQAIYREKQIKSWLKEKKVELIESINKEWKDLSEERNGEIYQDPSSFGLEDGSEMVF
jgi:putative endonuclease